MFHKVLIANRGEIAVRAIRTLRRLGCSSVAVYSSADTQSLHVRSADEAVHIGEAPARESYLDIERLLDVARATGSQAIFPGYGFLSESAAFAERCAGRGLEFIGPTPEQIAAFGLKHRARALAEGAGVPLLPGSGLLEGVEHARREAKRIGYPVMLKSTGGGGGIGLLTCKDEQELAARFETAVNLGASHFAQKGVFLERLVANARHIEVQIFGDGLGQVVALGLRDCSAQRRNQKVIEETPPPNVPPSAALRLQASAVELGRSCNYRSAGTVEFVYDADSGEFYFLEVNTRLQVEHGVTELVFGVDLVEWMVLTAAGSPPDLARFAGRPSGCAIEARVYAEAPARNFRPSSGLLTQVRLPNDDVDLRVDTWVETGVEVSPYYDPLLAKVMARAETRAGAIRGLAAALARTRIDGVDTNLQYLQRILALEEFTAGRLTTRSLDRHPAEGSGMSVVDAGTLSTVQDYPGRMGLWPVGIPPSGPMDALAFRLGNRVVGNPEGAPGIEMTMRGATFVFHESTTVALTGADMGATLDGVPLARYCPIVVGPGQELSLGAIRGPGARSYLCLRHGLDVPAYLGSHATFTLGRFGGHGGRALLPGDTLPLSKAGAVDAPMGLVEALQPSLVREWTIGVSYGPQGAPDFFTAEDIETFFATNWEVHYNSARTGVRLVGPKPSWARADGGEAGLHPSNIHDNAYAFGAVDFTGDMPIILGPDGPSLGGFVCPATVVHAELWKVGQLAPGDRVRFVPIGLSQAAERESEQDDLVAVRSGEVVRPLRVELGSPIIAARTPSARSPRVVYRVAGDKFVLVEYGDMVLDLRLRFRVHALMQRLERAKESGIVDLTPGVRSLMVHYDSRRVSLRQLMQILEDAERALGDGTDLRVPSRVVHLPLSWDDEATQLAIRKYTQLVRKDAPWAPSNIEFIRRINGLADEQAVKDIVFGASYLVLGLGDVYLGAPVATPIDPRHRLVTTKYNPARTWTPENAVGIGGAYLCIYGMEGPGGYQFVGRTLQVYNRFRVTRDFEQDKPWLLRFFDQIRFYPVSSKELLELREAFPAGRHELQTTEEVFDLQEYESLLARHATSIARFKERQQAAFDEERARWVEGGVLQFEAETETAQAAHGVVPEGCVGAVAPVPGSVWRLEVTVGQRIVRGERLVILESMKMEVTIESPSDGTVTELRASEGRAVSAGQVLVVIQS